MTKRIAINGMGRIGRCIIRAWHERTADDLEIVAVNDLADAATLTHLLKYDSVHGPWPVDISHQAGNLHVDKHVIKTFAEPDPARLPWGDLGVDVVLECTGRFRKHHQASLHLKQGAKKVLISAPSPDADVMLCKNVNDAMYDAQQQHIISCASCTTHCLSPLVKVLDDAFGIEHGLMTTIHSYTNNQRLLDSTHKDLRRARAAALSIIPTSTGAAKAIGKVIPALSGKLDGMSIRVPTPNVSLVDLVARVSKKVSVDAINQAVQQASQGSLADNLEYCEQPLVSSDFIGNSHSCIFDAPSTMVMSDHMLKVLAWYDNEWGFSCRMLDTAEFI